MRIPVVFCSILVLALMLPTAQAILPGIYTPGMVIVEEPEVVIDVKPDTLNIMSMGKYVMCYITPSEGYNARDIDVLSVSLEGVLAIPDKYGYTDINDDGICELMVKFDRSAIIAQLPCETCSDYLVHIEGSYLDGVSFSGADLISIIYSGGGRGR